MAEAAPRLSPGGDPAAYAPYSITAIIAALVAGIFLFAMLVLGGSALIGGQQLVEPLLLILPVAVLVLAFAARRQIRNSEGTRVGLNLCNFAWWVGILGGCGYAAYLVGRLVGVQQDTKDALVQWMANVQKADPIDTRNLDFHLAFQKTIDTGRQKSLDVKAPTEIEAAQRGFHEDTGGMIGITRFRQIDLLRVLHRNKDFAPQFTFDGLQTWMQDVSGLRAKSSGTLRCPEGEFALNFDMMRQPVPGDRPTWRVVAPAGGFIGGSRLTRYGHLIEQMEFTGRGLVNGAFLSSFGVLPQFRNRLPDDFARPDGIRNPRYYVRALAECAALGVAATARPAPTGYETKIKSQFFAAAPRSDGVKDGDPAEKFFAAWTEGRIVPSGLILRDSPDKEPIMTVTEKSVEYRVPVEIQQPRMESSQAAARGAVILVCDDPEFMAKMNEIRKAAAGESLSDESPRTAVVPSVPWRIVRIVSDMKDLTMPKEKTADAGGMGGIGG